MNGKGFKKILVLGSGALKIGEAGEFDYSGSQAIKALKEEGIKTILVNPNIATIQTSKLLADKIYFLPVDVFFVEKIIQKERPDGICLSFGGQTALNCGLSLYKKGILKKYNVTVLGTPVDAVDITEDRERFANHLTKLGFPTAKGFIVSDLAKAQRVITKLGFPVMVRGGFALGGLGSGIARNKKELSEIAKKAFVYIPQIVIEKYFHHYKEVEYEVVRDEYDNCITVCNMENMDPLGIHTGESIVVAPSQTLTNFEYHYLRSVAIEIVRSLKIVGECNVQFGVNPQPKDSSIDYFVIEVNARLSRSSALASKATGYPLAYVAAKLGLGKNLTSIKNKITQVTQSCFEPSLDYIVVKLPRWDIEKFKGAEERIGSSMKSVGEVMGIGRTFEEAYQKAIRMLDLELEGATEESLFRNGKTDIKQLQKDLLEPTPRRIFSISLALKKGMTVQKIYSLTGIDPWFLYRIKNIVDAELKLVKSYKSSKKFFELDENMIRNLKEIGFSDKQIGKSIGMSGLEVRAFRKKKNILPHVFQIDTLAGEFEAKTNYLYLTYNGMHDDVQPLQKNGVIVLGSGPYRIGSSVEFDWTCVNTVLALKKNKKQSIIINCNPETVSTDYDISDRLFFEELTFERIADIYDFENPYGVIISVGGQTPNNRARSLTAYGCTILGTHPESIDRAEDRSKFSKLLDTLFIKQPQWNKFTSLVDAIRFAKDVGYPVLIRPSYVLSGSNMKICFNDDELKQYITTATVSKEYPVTVSKFVDNAKEIEVDCVAKKGKIKALVASEHVENAGVHSGDASIILPPQKMYIETYKKLRIIAQDLAASLMITGPFNIQCLAKDNEISVIEINLRSSRTFPFISKVTGVNFIEMATDALFHKDMKEASINLLDYNFVAAKVAQFSFARLTGADPVLDVEMTSTGEVACFGDDVEEAFLKAELSVGGSIPKTAVFLSLGGEENKFRFIDTAKRIQTLDLTIYATEKTAAFLNKNAIPAKKLYKIHEHHSPNILEFFQKGKIDLAINIVDKHVKKDINDDYAIRRFAVDRNIPLFTDLKKAELFIKALTLKKLDDLPIKSWDEYI